MMRRIRLAPRSGHADARLADLRSEVLTDAVLRYMMR